MPCLSWRVLASLVSRLVISASMSERMSLDVLNILGLLTVNVTRDIEIEVVLLDLLDTHHAGVFGYLQPLVEDIDDLVQVAVTQAVLVAIFQVATAGVHHEDPVGARRALPVPLLVDDDDAGGNTSAIEQVGRQTDDPFDIALANEVFADVGLGITTKHTPCGRMQAPLPVLFSERTM